MLPFLGIMRLETKLFFLGYGKAFQRNQNPISGKQRRVALQLAAGIVPQAPSASETDYQIPEDALEAWKEAYIRHSK